MAIGNEIFSIDERDRMGKVADELASYVANFYNKDLSKIPEEELGFLEIARLYLKLYTVLFT